MEVPDIAQKTEIKTIPKEKKCKKAKWLSEESLQIAVKRREMKNKEEKERYTHLKAEFQRIPRIETIPKKKKCKKAKWLSEEALQIAEKRRETKGKGEREG